MMPLWIYILGARNPGGPCDNSHTGDVHDANFSTHRSNCNRNSCEKKEAIHCRENSQISQTNNLHCIATPLCCWYLCKSIRAEAIGTSSMAIGGVLCCTTCCCHDALFLANMFDETAMETNQDNLYRGGGTEHSSSNSYTESLNGTARCRSKFSARNIGCHCCILLSRNSSSYPLCTREMLQTDTVHWERSIIH